MTITPGKFKMMNPAWNKRRGYWIIGALVGADKGLTYVKQVRPHCTKDEIRRAYCDLRDQIHKEHPGIKEEFTILRPKHSYN